MTGCLALAGFSRKESVRRPLHRRLEFLNGLCHILLRRSKPVSHHLDRLSDRCLHLRVDHQQHNPTQQQDPGTLSRDRGHRLIRSGQEPQSPPPTEEAIPNVECPRFLALRSSIPQPQVRWTTLTCSTPSVFSISHATSSGISTIFSSAQ